MLAFLGGSFCTVKSINVFAVFSCVLASLYEGLSVRPSVRRVFSVFAKTRVFDVDSIGDGKGKEKGRGRGLGGRDGGRGGCDEGGGMYLTAVYPALLSFVLLAFYRPSQPLLYFFRFIGLPFRTHL